MFFMYMLIPYHVRILYVTAAGADTFHYTSEGECVTIDDVDDYSEFTATKKALTLLGFHDNQLQGIFRVLAAILHLGNVTVGRRAKGGEVMSVIGEDDSSLLTSATLLGIDPAHLAHWLSHRKITTSREVYHKPLTHAQVHYAVSPGKLMVVGLSPTRGSQFFFEK